MTYICLQNSELTVTPGNRKRLKLTDVEILPHQIILLPV